ncbi:hypothetical protein BURPS305_6487 [Burkholderia pseudomallei 305]|nr:hypothetical protein BURPS305_6487 [Burkholderia pseudomallei 305]
MAAAIVREGGRLRSAALRRRRSPWIAIGCGQSPSIAIGRCLAVDCG